ncbi:uncharacterized protein LACBIDRAFT_303049 [Laccaria bicolor S238N-H82]|uniref:Predicted protein n=1 Tax=Laccaria bicolor (strain S238N-H82 / ATCC MYA-4686) TaxID=486041 RepID=B0DIU7_LACBS|nr:uncharacterized protein LACBIDRAFT_303049 [Laccaria bicolor S238N-H82]EDR05404.1 predicted protein [Laccaria bicolor S238N-H82]|eukprot:XP_001883962.1 predicted protein [Laccaria bicolor S238N-H82]
METLRLYPLVSYFSRTTRELEDVIMPLSKPSRGLNGEGVREIQVPNNTNIIISIIATDRNPEIWGSDHSLQWIPERWLAPLPSSVTNAQGGAGPGIPYRGLVS